MQIFRRGKKGTWTGKMWVPVEYQGVAGKKQITVSLRTSSQTEAMRIAAEMENQLVANWDAKLLGKREHLSDLDYKRFVKIAKQRGFAYRPVDDLLDGPIEEMNGRVLNLKKEDPQGEDRIAIEALLGTSGLPDTKLSGLVDFHIEENRVKHAKKNKHEKKKSRRPLDLCVKYLIDVVGDKRVGDVHFDDAQVYLDWFKDRVAKAEITAETANKNIRLLRGMINGFFLRYRISQMNPFAAMKIKETVKASKPIVEFESDFIIDQILAPGSLPGLDPAIRDVAIIMALTGCRPSEITGVKAEHIHLGVKHNEKIYPGKVAVLEVEPDGRTLKTEPSKREVVLIDEAYEAIARNPQGFPDLAYTDKASNDFNDYLSEHNLRPTPDHTMYALRHSFKGRMKRAQILPSFSTEMMGHSEKAQTGNPVYGRKLSYNEKIKILLRIRPRKGDIDDVEDRDVTIFNGIELLDFSN